MRKVRVAGTIALGLACAVLAGCTGVRKVDRPTRPAEGGPVAVGPVQGHYKVGEPYQINGVWYYPHEDYSYREVGIASWYGPGFHGEKTANGEIYDMNDLTAAHRTLPMPSIVRVTNMVNSRAIQVRVNDRGPFANERIIDMSRRAAQLLGFENAGVTSVLVEIMAEESLALKSQLTRNAVSQAPKVEAAPRTVVASESLAPMVISGQPLSPPPAKPKVPLRTEPVAAPERQPVATAAAVVPKPSARPDFRPVSKPAGKAAKPSPPPAPETGTFISVASFENGASAERLAKRLAEMGAARVIKQSLGKRVVYRVRLGPVPRGQDPRKLLQKVKKAGFHDARLAVVK
ncbi:MAG: septal ring lytic transglycosylase RlpA family protein [Alphaproteobacteria bacterium]